MAHEFKELVLDGHNYPTWALNINISLAFRRILFALSLPPKREAVFLETYKFPSPIHHLESPPLRLDVEICDGGGVSVFRLH
jgi:hypothetical protein